jgi:hypothetical protein
MAPAASSSALIMTKYLLLPNNYKAKGLHRTSSPLIHDLPARLNHLLKHLVCNVFAPIWSGIAHFNDNFSARINHLGGEAKHLAIQPKDYPLILGGDFVAFARHIYNTPSRLAVTQPDPSGFLKSMFESVSAKLDQSPPELARKLASSEEAWALSTFFSLAEKAVRQRDKGAKDDPEPHPE